MESLKFEILILNVIKCNHIINHNPFICLFNLYLLVLVVNSTEVGKPTILGWPYG